MASPLPNMQFAVLSILAADSLPGRQIRAQLEVAGLKRGAPAFYRLMTRLEEAGLVSGWYEQEVIDRQIVRERLYRATNAGLRARDLTAEFHQNLMSRYSRAVDA